MHQKLRPLDRESVFSPESGYDLVASRFDHWRWSKVWDILEKPLVLDWLQHRSKESVGMDAGSGTGRYLEAMIALSLNCHAVDISAKMIDQARSKIRSKDLSRLCWHKASVTRTGLVARTLDWILCTRTLSHCQQVGPVFREFERLLVPGGEVLLTDIHPEHEYECTAIPFERQKIKIRTYKHSLRSLRQALELCPTMEEVSLDSVANSAGDNLLYVLRFQKKPARKERAKTSPYSEKALQLHHS